jgi:murein DD-endopeptidase MepM/ murein hydrolase activator NlpD
MQTSHPAPLWSGKWVTPTPGTSSSAYGRRRYVNGRWWGQHNGADVKAPSGTAVRVANSGRVVLSEYMPLLRGNCVVVDHGCNVFSIYMHLSQRLVAVGQNVGKGQLIGRVGARASQQAPSALGSARRLGTRRSQSCCGAWVEFLNGALCR